MKLMQQEVVFSPITIVAETAEEAEALWELMRFDGEPCLSEEAQSLATHIGNWFSNNAKL